MATTPFQPALPAPTRLNDQELNFIDDSPANLFVENQNSNIGAKRKVFSDKMKEVADQITTIYTERFIGSATQTLDQWEAEVGLPIAPASLSIQQRRTRIQARKRSGPFTRKRRQDVVETYLLSTFGQTTQLSLAGAALTPAGLPLYSDATSLTGLYTITENITNFSYTVTINSTAQVDQAGLQRELGAITPAGISFNIAYSAQPGPAQSFQKSGGGKAVASPGGTVKTPPRKTGGATAIAKAGGTKGTSLGTTRTAIVTWAEFETP